MKAFLEMYNTLHSGNLHKLSEVYREDIRFVDPAHEINGIADLTSYFESLYKNVRSITFAFEEPMATEKGGYVRWRMTFSHSRLAGGSPIHVDGVTYLERDEEGRVYYHRDYFDLGAMVYEHVVVLGRITRAVKRGLGQ